MYPLKPYRKQFSLLLFVGAFLMSACQKKEIAASSSGKEKSQEITCACETADALPDIPGERVYVKDAAGNVKLSFLKKNNVYVSGDMIFNQGQFDYLTKYFRHPLKESNPLSMHPSPLAMQKAALIKSQGSPNGRAPRKDSSIFSRTGIARIGYLWPNRTVYYTINGSLPAQARVSMAITHWQNQTNIIFVPRTNQANYIEFVWDPLVCASPIGMQGGRQPIYLADGCGVGQVIHEIGHAIGFFHEQSRSDRDNFVTINFNNIQEDRVNNYQTYTQTGDPGFELRTFDFNSVMLYSSGDFAKVPGTAVMLRLDGSWIVGQRDGLSTGDVETYNYMYNPSITAVVKYTKTRDDYDWNTGSSAVEGHSTIYFYTDNTRSTPLALTHPLKLTVQDLDTKNFVYWTIPAGVSSFNLGETWEYQVYDYGNLTYYSAGGGWVYPGVGYHYFWEQL
ncbi:M12 family metallopeptidase [Chitinophaga eiseniae]|uniref:Peptidase M12A domain-containing protein n=1 Tax=Chitinophaga eiseniae TaxID=634771 RepID=A0A847SSD5_9BACT|nr:M12 family metallopeptidase [Chitinophaga eiseniae]NLR80466.1 hypothetical protein [Chitinophaga eiseniae]